MNVQVWKVPLNSGRWDFVKDRDKAERARDFCFTKGWVGIGWGIDRLRDGLRKPDRYERAIPKAKFSSPRSARSAHRALAHRMQNGDFVWSRTKGNFYWLGIIESPWLYRNAKNFADFDLYQVRKCRWRRVGSADVVPGPVKNAFAGRGSAICQIRNEHEAVARATQEIWARLNGKKVRRERGFVPQVSLSVLGYDELEDLIALYLQAKMGWFIVPSTVKTSMPATEFVLRDRKGRRAYVQVKSGKRSAEPEVEVPPDVDVFFLFDLVTDRPSVSDKKRVWIFRNEIEDFARAHDFLLPLHLQSEGG